MKFQATSYELLRKCDRTWSLNLLKGFGTRLPGYMFCKLLYVFHVMYSLFISRPRVLIGKKNSEENHSTCCIHNSFQG